MSLKCLPYEVVSIITQYLFLEDVFHLALTCQHFVYLIRDDRRCKGFLETLASGTCEFREAKDTTHWARAFRRLVKRRQALRTAAPFTAAIVAVAESWIYKGGVLCYIQDRTLRVLDLHQSSSTETVVNIPGLLQQVVGEAWHRKRYKLQLLHYAEGLVTCLYSRAKESCLLILDARQQRLLAVSPNLESTHKIFVRNDANFLYYGTHSDMGEDGHWRWVLMRYDICKNQWLDQKIHLADMVGDDVGQTVCFEIVDGLFYGLSNQTSFELDEVDWNSYYHCFCFPVGNPDPKETRRIVRDKAWQRQHTEGPIDDRWSFLQLYKSEENGKLHIAESRKEWQPGKSSGQRTYYTMELVLGPKPGKKNEEGNQIEATHATTTIATPNAVPSDPSYSNSNDYPADSVRLASGRRMRTNYTLPTATTTRLRDPHNTHLGDDASTALLLSFSKCPVRSYHAASQAFLDLVEDPTARTTQLRLRAGARYALPASSIPSDSPAFNNELPHTERIKHFYKDAGANDITFWPPTPEGPHAGAFRLLETLMNPPSHVGNVQGTWDERSLVYSTGNNANGVQAVVFLGFDPAIKLQGIQQWEKDGVRSTGATRKKEEQDFGVAAISTMRQLTPLHAEECREPVQAKGEDGQDDIGEGVAVAQQADDFAATWATEKQLSAQVMLVSSSYNEELAGTDANATWPYTLPPKMHPLQQPDKTAQKEFPILKQCAQEFSAMHQEICFGFNELPDFKQQRKISKVGGVSSESGQ